jgi:hypothetical protein
VKSIALVLAVILAGFAAFTGALLAGDASVLVPPPEAVAEQLMRALQTHRYSQAEQYLAEPLARKTSTARLAELQRGLEEKHGRVENVTGERAGAGAIVEVDLTGGRSIEVPFAMTQEDREWRVADLGGLALAAGPAEPGR